MGAAGRPLLLAVVLALVCWTADAAAPSRNPTSMEYVRDAIVSLVRVMHDTGDKLERHEFRERQLGEQLKKTLTVQGKRTNDADERLRALAAAVSAVDGSLRRAENQAKLREARQAEQLERLQASLERMEAWQKVTEELVRSQNKVLGSSEEEGAAAKVADVATRLALAVDRLEARLASPQDGAVQPCPVTSEGPGDLRLEVVTALEAQNSSLEETKRLAGAAAEAALEARAAAQQAAERATSVTLERLEDVRRELSAATFKSAGALENKLTDLQAAAAQDHEEVVRAVSEGNQAAEELSSGVSASYEQLRSEVQALGKVEKVLIQTADNVLDTKRRIEYGVKEILLQVGDTIKIHTKDLNNTFNRRFDDISATILDNQTGALANLSSKIEQEISQVWRQIGTMYNTLTASTTALDRLQHQTEQYVNGSLLTMDSMEGKVGKITGRMSFIDENLNFLLGRLSFVSTEFNQIKLKLGAALDDIKNSFLEAQNKINDLGPGPKRIPSTEVLNEDNTFSLGVQAQ